jgi:hypothetical protein
MASNIPEGYNMDGGRSGFEVREEETVELHVTDRQIELIEQGLIQLQIEASFEPADKEMIGELIELGENLRLSKLKDNK